MCLFKNLKESEKSFCFPQSRLIHPSAPHLVFELLRDGHVALVGADDEDVVYVLGDPYGEDGELFVGSAILGLKDALRAVQRDVPKFASSPRSHWGTDTAVCGVRREHPAGHRGGGFAACARAVFVGIFEERHSRGESHRLRR